MLATVGNATLLLAGLLRRLLELPATGDIRGPLPIVVGMGSIVGTRGQGLGIFGGGYGAAQIAITGASYLS